MRKDAKSSLNRAFFPDGCQDEVWEAPFRRCFWVSSLRSVRSSSSHDSLQQLQTDRMVEPVLRRRRAEHALRCGGVQDRLPPELSAGILLRVSHSKRPQGLRPLILQNQSPLLSGFLQAAHHSSLSFPFSTLLSLLLPPTLHFTRGTTLVIAGVLLHLS